MANFCRELNCFSSGATEKKRRTGKKRLLRTPCRLRAAARATRPDQPCTFIEALFIWTKTRGVCPLAAERQSREARGRDGRHLYGELKEAPPETSWGHDFRSMPRGQARLLNKRAPFGKGATKQQNNTPSDLARLRKLTSASLVAASLSHGMPSRRR